MTKEIKNDENSADVITDKNPTMDENPTSSEWPRIKTPDEGIVDADQAISKPLLQATEHMDLNIISDSIRCAPIYIPVSDDKGRVLVDPDLESQVAAFIKNYQAT